MKKTLMIGMMTLILLGYSFGVQNSKKQVLRDIYQAYHRLELAKSLEMVEKALKTYRDDNELLKLKYSILMDQKKYAEALAFIDKEIKKSGESQELLAAKYNILFVSGDLPGALKVARKKYQKAKKKSPWDCMNIMHVYLRMGSKNEALDWLQEAVKHGFISYRILDDKKYKLLENEERFYQIIEMIKMSIGLGYPAKNFSLKLLSGESLSLSSLKGKVVMVYFWATWCESCRLEIPHLNQYYKHFNDKGLEIVAINLDSGVVGMTKMKEFIKQLNLKWKHSCSGKGWKDDTVKQYGVNSLPSLWVVDRNGILRSFNVKGQELGGVLQVLVDEQN